MLFMRSLRRLLNTFSLALNYLAAILTHMYNRIYLKGVFPFPIESYLLSNTYSNTRLGIWNIDGLGTELVNPDVC